jgi:WD40 repeat protein
MPHMRVCLIAILAVAVAAFAADGPGEADFKKIQEQATAPRADVTKARAALSALRMAHPGTPAALKAAALSRTLSSPLDALSPKSIPAIQKFDWHPKETVAIVGDHRGRQGSPVYSVAFSPDGKRLVSGGSYNVRIWDTATMRLLHQMYISGAGMGVQFSKDGSRLACATNLGYLHIWDAPASGEPKQVQAISVSTSALYAVTFHPSGKRLACPAYEGIVNVYDLSEEKPKVVATLNAHKGAVQAASWSPDGKLLATGGADKTVRVWETANFKEVSLINGPAVSSLTFSGSSRTLAVGYSDGSVSFWGSPPARRPKLAKSTFSAGKSAVVCLSFVGSRLATANAETSARIWSAATAKITQKAQLSHGGPVRCVAISPDGKLAATGGDDWIVRTFDISKAKPVERFYIPTAHTAGVYGAAFSPDCTTLATGSYDKMVRTWSLTKAAPEAKLALKGEAQPIYCVDFSPDGKLLAASGLSLKVRQWEAKTGKPRTSLVGQSTYTYFIAYSPSGKWLLTQSGKEALICDSFTGGTEHRLATHKTNVVHSAWSPDGKTVATLSGYYKYEKGKIVTKGGAYVYEDCLMRFFDVESGKEREAKKELPIPPRCVAFVPGTDLTLVGTGDNLLQTWKLAGDKLTEAPAWKLPAGAPLGYVTSPDGKFVLVTNGSHSFLQLSADGKAIAGWAFKEPLARLALAPDCRHVAVGLSTGVTLVMRLQELRDGGGALGVTGPKDGKK